MTTATTTPVLIDLVNNGLQSQSANELVTSSSWMLKWHEEEMEKDKKLSPDSTLARQQPVAERQQE